MADFQKTQNKLNKERNEKLDHLVDVADPTGSAAKESENKEQAKDKKTTGYLKSMAAGITGLWGSAKQKLKGVGGGIMKFLKGTVLAGLMVALLAFLNSETWQRMKENILKFIEDPSLKTFANIFGLGEGSLFAVIGGLTALFILMKNPLKVGGAVYKGIKGLVFAMTNKKGFFRRNIRNITGLFGKGKTPGAEAAKGAGKKGFIRTLFSTASSGVKTALGTLFKVPKGLGKLVTKVMGPMGSILVKALGPVGSIFKVASGAIGTGLGTTFKVPGKLGSLFKGKGILSIFRTAAGAMSGALGKVFNPAGGTAAAARGSAGGGALKAGKGLLKMAGGLLRFAGPVGLLVTAATGIFGGVTAAMDEYKRTGDLGKAIKEGSAGALSALTFGLISQETFSQAFTAVGDMWDSAVCGVADMADKAWQGVKSILPTAEGMKRTFNKLGEDLSPLKEIHIPEKLSFSEIKKSVISVAKGLNKSFENITGINIHSTLCAIGDGVANAANKLKEGFEDVFDIDLDKTFSAVKDKVSGFFKKAGGFFGGLFGGKELKGGLKEAVEAGLYKADHGWTSGDSEINRKALEEGVKSGKISKSILDAIIEDNDLADEDMEFMKKLVDKATEIGSLFTHDQGLHDRLDELLKHFKQHQPLQLGKTTGDRSEQILGAGINRNMMGMAGHGPALVSAPINNVNNSQSNTTVSTTQMTHPSPLLNAVNMAA